MVQIYFHLVDPCQYMYHINMPVLSVDAIAMSGKHEVDLPCQQGCIHRLTDSPQDERRCW